ncbi:hypothetical protein TD95_001627, partial [Thielaviopsis punctulata]
TYPGLSMNQHFAAVGDESTEQNFEHGIQVINEDKEFNSEVSTYLRATGVAPAGFNYHIISVLGSQSTGKSTLLNNLFRTQFSTMSETERRQTTKGIWMSKNKAQAIEPRMADNILVMDVEGTDGRERGEDQDFERKSALFALATSEVLLVNLWETQVGLYQGANMGLLKTVFEVNMQLFLKDKKSTTRSLLFFVLRDHLGTTPLVNLQNTLIQDMTKIWTSIAKPPGLENSRIEDYFDFGFAALPHKILQPDKFVVEIDKLRTRFSAGHRPDSATGVDAIEGGIFLPEYHRRIPADGVSVYAQGIWDQIVDNKDLDLPTQQELLAQFRCDEISREVLIDFEASIAPLEEQQAQAVRLGQSIVLENLGEHGSNARQKCIASFEVQASRYHKGVYTRKRQEMEAKIDGRLKALYQGQLHAVHKTGVAAFNEGVSNKVKQGQRSGAGSYEFAEIVVTEKEAALKAFLAESTSLAIEGVAWTDFKSMYDVFEKELDEQSARLRKDELRRLAVRVERWVRSVLGDSIGLEFGKLGLGRDGSGGAESSTNNTNATGFEKDLWDNVWAVFVKVVAEAETRFRQRATSFEASTDEVDTGLWKLRRKSWVALRERVQEEVMEGNILLKLRENFEDKFRYDDAGVPRIWRPTDDIEGVYTKARESTLALIPVLSKFKLQSTGAAPDLPAWIGTPPMSAAVDEEEEGSPIGGVDEAEGKSLEEEMTIMSEAKRQDLVVRFKKTADGVYVEAKRGALGGVTMIPWYFYGLLVVLGWNELFMIIRNPLLVLLVLIIGGGTYIAYMLNLLGPMIQMANAAATQGMELGKEQLRDFIANSEMARSAIGVPARNATASGSEGISLDTLDSTGKKSEKESLEDI